MGQRGGQDSALLRWGIGCRAARRDAAPTHHMFLRARFPRRDNKCGQSDCRDAVGASRPRRMLIRRKHVAAQRGARVPPCRWRPTPPRSPTCPEVGAQTAACRQPADSGHLCLGPGPPSGACRPFRTTVADGSLPTAGIEALGEDVASGCRAQKIIPPMKNSGVREARVGASTHSTTRALWTSRRSGGPLTVLGTGADGHGRPIHSDGYRGRQLKAICVEKFVDHPVAREKRCKRLHRTLPMRGIHLASSKSGDGKWLASRRQPSPLKMPQFTSRPLRSKKPDVLLRPPPRRSHSGPCTPDSLTTSVAMKWNDQGVQRAP